jgi:hypothetical protein
MADKHICRKASQSFHLEDGWAQRHLGQCQGLGKLCQGQGQRQSKFSEDQEHYALRANML